MKSKRLFKTLPCLFLSMTLCFSGCSTLKPEQMNEFGYKGTPIVREGRPVKPIDWLGNFFGAFSKLILWNWKVERHNIQPETEKAVADYLNAHTSEIGDVSVQLNRYAPQESWKRLFSNKGVKWPYRYTFGFLSVLFLDTIFAGRVFGGDRYDPFTHTVHLYSDLPSIALHELGHAHDFALRRYRGSYALFRIIPFADLYQEYHASHEAFDYVREEKMTGTELEAYKVLYPAYGTYAGGYLFRYGSVMGAVVGHMVGRYKAHQFEKSLA